MIKGLIASELLFPDVVYFFGPRPNQQKYSTYPKRQKVRGKLRLVASRPIKLNRVELRLRGSTELNWRDPVKPQHSILAERMHAWRTLRKSKNVLLENATLPAGVTELGFEITIPGHLCPSFKSEYLSIEYGLSARILPNATFAKEMYIERGFRIQKTLMPQDVAHGRVSGYKVPRLTMRGERPGCLAWEFRVPRWICLEDEKGIEFDGVFKLNDATGRTRVKKVQVDVVQEELYRDDKMRASLYKRHLVVSTNAPSTYLHPPFDTNISFSFPLQPVKPDQYDTTTLPRPRRPRASSSPSTPQSHKLHRSNTCTSLSAKNVSADGSTTTITLGNLTYSLDSPFLDIRHFIRLIVHVSGQVRPICIGLPIKITAKVDESDLGILDADELPTYQSVACDEERLPDYTSGLDRPDTNADLNSARNSLEPCCWVREPLVVHDGRRDNSRRRRRTVEGGSGYTNPAAAVATAAENHTSNLDFIDLEELLGIPTATSPPPSTINHTACACTEHGCILAEERGLDDFGILQSHQ